MLFADKVFFEMQLTKLTATKNTDIASVLPSFMQWLPYMPSQLGKAAGYHVYISS